MAKLVSTLFISLDGVAEIDETWHFPYFDDNMARAVSHDYDGVDTLLLGRVTYDSFAGAWPDREKAGEEDAEFAKFLGDVRKLVVSRQPLEFTWRNSELLDGDLVEVASLLLAVAGDEGNRASVSGEAKDGLGGAIRNLGMVALEPGLESHEAKEYGPVPGGPATGSFRG